MLWWLSVAPLGKPVVPLVNWMLMGSSNCSVSASERSRSRSVAPASAGTSAKLYMPAVVSVPRRTTVSRCGSFSAFSAPGRAPSSSGASRRSISM